MKIKITWKDRKKEEFEAHFDEESAERLRKCLVNSFATTVIVVGDPHHTFYYLSDARKVEIDE